MTIIVKVKHLSLSLGVTLIKVTRRYARQTLVASKVTGAERAHQLAGAEENASNDRAEYCRCLCIRVLTRARVFFPLRGKLKTYAHNSKLPAIK